jgi:hypothetical protein
MMRHEEQLKLGTTTTLDEPVSETIMRDLRNVGSKLKVVLMPLREDAKEDVIEKLREWDLWGPLLVCLLLSSILSVTAPSNSAALVFAAVFVIVWAGAAAVTLNAQLLGGNISFFQSICILGYCVFPLTISAFALMITSFFFQLVSIFRTIIYLCSKSTELRQNVFLYTAQYPCHHPVISLSVFQIRLYVYTCMY